MFMGHSQGFEYSFKNNEECNCANEDQRYISLICGIALEGLGQDVNHSIAYDGPTSQCIELVHEYFETRLTQTPLAADQYDSCYEAHQRETESCQEAVSP